MNAERLYILAKGMLNEFKRSNVSKIRRDTKEILEKIKHSANTYGTSEYKEEYLKKEVAGKLKDLFQFIDRPENLYPSYFISFLNETGIYDNFGLNLKNKINKIINAIGYPSNTIVDVKYISDEIVQLIDSIDSVEKFISNIVEGLSFYDIQDLCKKELCEIILTIPRRQVQENLKSLGQELISFEKNLSVFSEIATGSREPVRVKTIASSEFSIFLESAPAIGACIAVAVERIISLYKQSLEIKKIKLELEKHKVPDTISALLDNHINSIVSAAAEKIAAEVMEKHAARLEESRKNELLIELRHSIENLAEKIDKGFQIEVSVAELGEEKKENGGQLTADEIDRKQIAESAKKIIYPISSGDPVPTLPEKEAGKEE